MKETTAGIIFIFVWVCAMLILSDNRNTKSTFTPCEFMSSGQYSVNC